MTDIIRPQTSDDVLDAVKWAVEEDNALEILGAGSKQGWGRPAAGQIRLTLAGLSGITFYEPGELVMTARAGTPLAAIERELGTHGQCLAFEPPDYSAVFGSSLGAGTIGGAFACNCSGPGRIKAGAARDHILGFRAVSGRGECIKSGGRVVKNVTGFDLSKLMAGSFGTLAVLTEVTFRALPAPEQSRTLFVLGLDDAEAVAAMRDAAATAVEASAFAHLPPAVAAAAELPAAADGGSAVTAFRLEGAGPSVDARMAGLKKLLAKSPALAEIREMESHQFWHQVRDLKCLARSGNEIVWRLSVPPGAGAGTVARIAAGLEARWFYDWAGGLIWLALDPGQSPEATKDVTDTIRGAAARAGGHATLFRAPAPLRADAPAFEPLAPDHLKLTRQIKDGFDPQRILNPGRMYAGL